MLSIECCARAATSSAGCQHLSHLHNQLGLLTPVGLSQQTQAPYGGAGADRHCVHVWTVVQRRMSHRITTVPHHPPFCLILAVQLHCLCQCPRCIFTYWRHTLSKLRHCGKAQSSKWLLPEGSSCEALCMVPFWPLFSGTMSVYFFGVLCSYELHTHGVGLWNHLHFCAVQLRTTAQGR